MDVQMPLCNGLEATKRIREIENSTEIGELPLSHILNRYRIPILATSASVYESDVVNCIQAGMDGFVNKPIDVSLLDKLLKGSIDSKVKGNYIISETGKRQEGAWFDDRKLRP
jgi:CheY-like chemotaxis protein